MAMNWPFGMVTGQPWEMVVREGVLVLFAKNIEGDLTTAECMVTVARDGETCISCASLKDNTLLKGEMQQHHTGLLRSCMFLLL